MAIPHLDNCKQTNTYIYLTDKSPTAMLKTNTEFLTEQNSCAAHCLVMANLSMTSETEKRCFGELFGIICTVNQ